MRPRIASIENLISQDPAGRNIFGLVRPDHLRLAALSLAHARRVLIVSGFYILRAGAGETDGPLGAKALGEALTELDVAVEYATDSRNRSLFEALGTAPLHGWAPDLLARGGFSHLVAVERVGRAADGRYYNMRGEDLEAGDEPLDSWFLEAEQRGIVTIGIGDGGNEIGMGNVFGQVQEDVQHGGRIASIVPADYTVVAGVSNWGAYGLVAAISVLTGRDLLPAAESATRDLHAILAAGAVDGNTGRAEASVDAQPWSRNLAVLGRLRQQIAPPPLCAGTGRVAAVIGLGETGLAAARLLRRHGHALRLSDQAQVALPEDLRDAPAELGGHAVAFLAAADLAVTSPGIAASAPVVAELQGSGMPVMSELEAACQLSSPPLIAVTGSVGKRSTAERIASLFAAHDRPMALGGNKGVPLSALLAGERDPRACVLAVSSFQLESVVHFRPRIAVMLNLHAQHVDRHGSLAELRRIKSRIFMNQRGEDVLVLNVDDPRLAPLAGKAWSRTVSLSARGPVSRGVWVEGGRVWARVQPGTEGPLALGPAPRQHAENLLAAAAVGLINGLAAESVGRSLFG